MAYSTQTQLENNVEMIEQTITDSEERATWTSERIAFADKIVQVDCSNLVDLSLVPDDTTTPVINLLSQFKSAEMALRRITGVKRRKNENDDISEWKVMYDSLLEKIKIGETEVKLSDGTVVSRSHLKFQNTARPDIRPEFGYDEYGEFLNNDDLETLRGSPDDTVLDN